MREEIRRILSAHADEKYKDFSASLIPGARPLIGVRLPELRKLAKSITDGHVMATSWNDEVSRYDGIYEDLYFEETMLRGMMIGYGTAKADVSCEKGLQFLKVFIPYVDNWSVCDSFCNTFSFANKYRDEVWEFLQPYLYSDKEYEVRVAIILLLNQYLKYDANNKKIPRKRTVTMEDLAESSLDRDHSYLGKILDALNRPFTQGYYARMAAAWTLAEAFVCFPYETNRMLTDKCKLDEWTYHKTLQKIRESKNPDKEVKEYIKSLKNDDKSEK